MRTRTAVFAFLIGAALSLVLLGSAAAQDYLPFFVGSKWVLRNPSQSTPVVFEAEQQDGDGMRFRATTPWNVSEWTLVNHGGQYFMTAYGEGNGLGPVPGGTLYFDFTRPGGTKWSNKLGQLSITSKNANVEAGGHTFTNCVEIKHSYGKGYSQFTFAPGVGFVQFSASGVTFVLDPSASTLPGQPAPKPVAEPPVESVPSPSRSNGGHRSTLIGMTFNRFATDPDTPDSLIKRFDQTLDAGVNFVVANGYWQELEPKPGQYSLGSLNYLVSATKGMPLSYTLRVIDTLQRNVPPDLKNERWNSPKMISRLTHLVDALAPQMQGHVRWFILGYEPTEYFRRHPNEIEDYIALYREISEHVKQRIPGIKVSCTFTFTEIDDMKDRLSPLINGGDVLALTYSPLKGDFSVNDPSSVVSDFAKMKRVANGRKIFLQEIAYPSSPVTGSSEDKQAEFYTLAFREIDRNTQYFDAVNWMTLADLSNATTQHLSEFYGGKGVSKFEATLQTLGVFDGQGKPKKAWEVFREQVRQ